MVEMGAKSVFADCYGLNIVGISRRYVAYIHSSPLRHCAWYIESRDSDTTKNEQEHLSFGNHFYLVLFSRKAAATGRTGSIICCFAGKTAPGFAWKIDPS
jgi:hypothetical protein